MRLGRRHVLAIALGLACMFSMSGARAIVGGQPADPGEYPWMAAIYSGNSPDSGWYCGGSLIAPRWVVTAAHCITAIPRVNVDDTIAGLPIDLLGLKVKVMLGRNSMSGEGGEEIVAKRLRTNPDKSSDVALLELAEPSSQQPIAWAQPENASLFAAGVTSTITGWGLTDEGCCISDELREATVPIISDARCSEQYDGGNNPATELCAGLEEGGVDTCQGDSGGPLTVPGPGGAPILAGITSWGEGCARPGKAGVYAEVAAAVDFIEAWVTP